jgi:hypothetical protein
VIKYGYGRLFFNALIEEHILKEIASVRANKVISVDFLKFSN